MQNISNIYTNIIVLEYPEFNYIFTFTGAFYTFIYFRVLCLDKHFHVLCLFCFSSQNLVQRTPYSIYCNSCPAVINFIGFCLYRKVIILPYFRRTRLVSTILDCLFVGMLKKVFPRLHSFLSCKISLNDSAYSFLQFSMYVRNLFYFTTIMTFFISDFSFIMIRLNEVFALNLTYNL